MSDAQKGARQCSRVELRGLAEILCREPKVQLERRCGSVAEPVTVIGVLPPGMRFPQICIGAARSPFRKPRGDALLFQPLVPSERDLNADMGNFNYKAIARLKPGVTLAQASAELDALQNRPTRSPRICPFISELRLRR